ncbi:MAG: flagellar biosynthesis protein FliQ [Candidatus Margulisiibacteriota bacterium]
MGQDFVAQVMQNGIITLFIISLPSVGVGLLVGFIISLFQAVTQIQEQTLTFVPKVIAVFLVVAFTTPWVAAIMIDYTLNLWSNIPYMVK